jgi:hypothetical protein
MTIEHSRMSLGSVEQEIRRSHEFEINFSQAIAKEQKEHSEKVKRECVEAINDVKTSLTSAMGNNQTLWNQWTASHANAHRWEQESYQQQLEAFEQKLTSKQFLERNN